MHLENHYKGSIDRLLSIMNELREKCPWDQKQTLETLRQLTIEETYELADAIDKRDWQSLKEELGDLLLHIVFYAKIANENQAFTIQDVIQNVCDKIVYRHPHIYTFLQVRNDDEVKRNWEKLKLKEGKKSVLSGVPNGLPAMVKALRIQEKAKQVGFEWHHIKDVKNKIEEEWSELHEAIAQEQKNEIENEFGDVLFAMINYARFLHIDPEKALAKTNEKFKNRFEKMEEILTTSHASLSDYTLEEMDAVWNQVKKDE